jgi:hypothetical protein
MSRWIQAFVVAGLLTLAAGCAEESAADAEPGDQGAREGIVFPDTGGRDGAGQVDAPQDAPPWLEASAPDGPAKDAPPPDLLPPDLLPPDLTPPDLTLPDQPLPACSAWSHYSCQPGGSPYTCTATCTLRSNQVIRCMTSFLKICICIKNGSSVGTCSLVGSGCSSCQTAVSCCFSKF